MGRGWDSSAGACVRGHRMGILADRLVTSEDAGFTPVSSVRPAARSGDLGSRLLVSIVESLPDAIVSIDQRAVVTSWNAAAERLFGYAAEEVLGTRFMQLELPESLRPRDSDIERALSGEVPEPYEGLLVGEGRRTCLSVALGPVRDLDGSIIGASIVARDITEHAQAERAWRESAALLRESEARLRAMLDGTCEFIGLLSPEGRILESNRAALEWVGCTSEQVIGQLFCDSPWWDQTPGAQEQVRLAVQRAANGEFVRQEVTLGGPKGSGVFDFSLYPVKDAQGKVSLIVPEGRDITERIRATRELERRYRDGQTLTEINRTLVGAFDFDQVTSIVCRAVRELTGADGASFVLREGDRVRYVNEDGIAPLWKGQDFPIESCISGWAMLHSQTAIIADIDQDDRIPVASYRQTVVRSLVMTPVGPGTPVASIGAYWGSPHEADPYEVELLHSLASAADLALAGVRAYHDARRAWAEAEQANRLKDQFLATLSHELRNPLNSIVGFSELLLRTREARSVAVIQQAAMAINGNAQAQARLINDLLDLSRLQTGKLALERHPVDLAPLVGDAVETARAQATEKKLSLSVELAPGTLRVNADHVRVQQIIWNLVNNAIKFTPPGGRVSVRLTERNGRAELVVEDTGQGIAAEFLPHVFEMFRQADAGTTRAHGGLGIGLALVRQLCELHDGRVDAESAGLGFGARFIVQLPLNTTAVSERPRPTAAAPAELRGARVLVVDDTEDSVEMLRLLLCSEGAEVVGVSSGEAALAAAQAAPFDLIVSDISMPGMDGYELIRRLRATAGYANTPAIALTGFGRDEDIQRSRRAGFDTQLTKPLDFPSFVRLARAALNE
jgi:PAS domain S-box-containing protein